MALIYVTTTGNDTTGTGAIGAPYASWLKAGTVAVAGDTILLQPTTFTAAANNTNGWGCALGNSGTTTNRITMKGNGGVATLDCSNVTHSAGHSPKGLYIGGSFITIEDVKVTNVHQVTSADFCVGVMAIDFGAGATDVILRRVESTGHGGPGFVFSGNNLHRLRVENCDSHHNYDILNASPGDNADGFSCQAGNSTGIVFDGCRAWWNSDDGIDLYSSAQVVTIRNCWSFWNGYVPGTFTAAVGGDGQGFKTGFTGIAGNRHVVTNCLAVENLRSGFDDNGGNQGVAGQFWYNNTAIGNHEFQFLTWELAGGASSQTLRNNLALGSVLMGDIGGNVGSATDDDQFNSWNTPPGVTITSADFQSISSVGMDGARRSSGRLPALAIGRLTTTSQAIDKGTPVGLPYMRSAPDLGAYEMTTLEDHLQAIDTKLGGLVPVFINAVAQYGAVGNGSTDNSTALIAMRNAMLAAPERHYVIFFEPGDYRYTNNRWLWNVQSFEVLGHGCTFMCTLSGGAGNHVNNSQPLLSEDPWVNDGDVMYSAADAVHNGYLIDTVAAGLFAVTCTTHADAGNFAAGNRVVLHGFAQQLGGVGSYPPNPRYFEYLVVDSANSSTGVVTFRQALKFMYDSAWYDTTSEGNAYWGKPRLMQLERANNKWPKLAIFSGGYWAADPNDTRGAGDEGFAYCAEVLLLRDLTLDAWWPRFHRYARADNCQILITAEGDKMVDTLVLGPGCILNGGNYDDSFRECTGVQNLLIDGVVFHDCVRIRPRRGIIRNSVIHGRSNNAGYVLDAVIYATQQLIIENTQLINHHSALLAGIALNDIESITVTNVSGATIRFANTGNNADVIAQRIEIGTVLLTRDGVRGGVVTNITWDGTYFVMTGDWYVQPQASDVLYWSCMGELVINRVTMTGGNKAPLLYDKFRSYPNKITRYEYATKDVKWTGEDVLHNYVRGRIIKIAVSVDSVYTGAATTAFLAFYTDDSGTGGNSMMSVDLKAAGYREVTIHGGVGKTNDTFGATYIGTWVHWMSVQPYGNGGLTGLATATYQELPKLRIMVDVLGPMT